MASGPNNAVRESGIGLIPEDWEVATFGERVDVKSGQVDPREQPYCEMLHVGPENIQEASGRLLRCRTAEELKLKSGKYLFTPDDVIYSKIRPYLRKAALPEFEGICSADMYPLRPADESLCRDFLYFWLLSDNFTKQAVSYQSRTGIPKINRQQLGSTLIPLPALPEQQAIAHVLRTVQRAKEATEKVIAAARTLKQSLMRHLFTYGPVPFHQADQVELKETDIGRMPSHWHLERFNKLLQSRLGKMLSKAARTGKSARPYVRNANVQWGKVDLTDLYEMDFDESEQEKFKLLPGDVLICEGGEVGRTAIWRGELEECYYQKAIHCARPRDERMSPGFLTYHMMNAFLIRNAYGIVGTDTTIAHLPGIKLKALPMPVAPREEQDRVVEVLDTADTKLQAEEGQLKMLDALLQTLLHNLMTGKVRVHDLDLAESGG